MNGPGKVWPLLVWRIYCICLEESFHSIMKIQSSLTHPYFGLWNIKGAFTQLLFYTDIFDQLSPRLLGELSLKCCLKLWIEKFRSFLGSLFFLNFLTFRRVLKTHSMLLKWALWPSQLMLQPLSKQMTDQPTLSLIRLAMVTVTTWCMEMISLCLFVWIQLISQLRPWAPALI